MYKYQTLALVTNNTICVGGHFQHKNIYKCIASFRSVKPRVPHNKAQQREAQEKMATTPLAVDPPSITQPALQACINTAIILVVVEWASHDTVGHHHGLESLGHSTIQSDRRHPTPHWIANPLGHSPAHSKPHTQSANPTTQMQPTLSRPISDLGCRNVTASAHK